MRNNISKQRFRIFLTLVAFILFSFQNYSYSNNLVENDTIGFNKYKGVIINKAKKPLIFASLTVNGTNISTVSNSKGEFLLKVPKKYFNKSVTVSFLGYTSKIIYLKDLKKTGNKIILETHVEELSEVSITIKDVNELMREFLTKRKQNYLSEPTIMTSFYRETIKKRRTYVSLSEAIVTINKAPYTSSKKDVLQLIKSRKSTDYKKLDTISLKLKGGPFSTLYLDVMRNPDQLFTEKMFENYDFTLNPSTKIDNKIVYVVSFVHRNQTEMIPYSGKLFINSHSLALVKAQFEIDLTDKEKVKKYFVLKKPRKADVTPIEAKYYVDYQEKNGKWYHNYSRIQLGFKVNYEKRLFNSVFYTTMEMAITDWKKNPEDKSVKLKDRLKSSVIMADEASGFKDPQFWGEYNVIEPEKPIEVAIKKISKQLKKIKD